MCGISRFACGAVGFMIAASFVPRAEAQYSWNRLNARFVNTLGEDARAPAPPTQPNFSTKNVTQTWTDGGLLTEFGGTLSHVGAVATKNSTIVVNASGLPKWMFYGGLNGMGIETPATDSVSWSRNTNNTHIAAGAWHHDGDHPQMANGLGLQSCGGKWRLVGPQTANVTGRFEYSFTSTASGASWFNYHTGQFRVQRNQFNAVADTWLLDVWHQGLVGVYKYWTLQVFGPGFPPIAMGNQTSIGFGPYGGTVTIDTVAPNGVQVGQDVELVKHTDANSDYIVLPSIEHIAVTGNPIPTPPASGSTSTNWKLYFTITGAY